MSAAINQTANPLPKVQSDLSFVAFALSDCTVQVDREAARYLRAVHRTALELAVPNYFGARIGGFWLLAEQVARLRALSEHYPANQAQAVARAVNAYLEAQLKNSIAGLSQVS